MIIAGLLLVFSLQHQEGAAVVADAPFFLKAQDFPGCAGAVGDKSAARLLWGDREGGVVGRQIALPDPAIGRLEGGNAGQRHLLGQAVLERSEGPLGSARASGE